MGWSFSYHDIGREAHIKSLTDKRHFSEGYTPLEHRVVGNHVWQLVQMPSGRKFICLDLIAKDRNGGWGYKGMSEDMGPCYYDCPLSLLNKADPVDAGYAVEWRSKVRTYHAARKTAKPAPDMVVTYGGHQYRLVCQWAPRKGWKVIRISDGCEFRMKAHQLSKALRNQ